MDVSAISDTEVEGVEQFELYFENLPSTFATVGEIDTVCVNITDGSKLIERVITTENYLQITHTLITYMRKGITYKTC